MRTRFGVWLLAAGAAGCAAVAWHVLRDASPRPVAVPRPYEPQPISFLDAGPEPEEQEDRAYSFRLPTGEPAALSCEAARAVVAQARGNLAYDPDPVAPRGLASGTADWLDPHGLWSAAPDAPIEALLSQKATSLLRELEGPTGATCPTARDIGAALVSWVGELAKRFDRERAAAAARPADVKLAADDSIFEAAAVNRQGRELAAMLGQRVGAFESCVGEDARPLAEATRARFFPALDAEGWSKVVLGAAVRAYVQIVDPHGAWAPFDEEASVYEVDLESRPPDRLWEKATRTAVGVRMVNDPRPPLLPDDVVVSIAGVTTGGLPLEQIEQLGYAAGGIPDPVNAVVLRSGERLLRTLSVPPEQEAGEEEAGHFDGVVARRVAYGPGDALVVTVHDVRDDLGDELARALSHEREADSRPIEGVLIDLRGNGGGSTEGAIAALGLFLPGVPLFPMKRRDGTIETDRAPEPPAGDRWNGPVATLVDGDTASAAEMIAGALAVYRRGPSVGAPTYGKGCAQEYVDDDAHAGVLRLTTLLYALPDGAPVQRVGLTPVLLLPLAPGPSSNPVEREATLPHAPPSWRGPDVREHLSGDVAFAWPPPGTIGPCKDENVCRALRALGGAGAKRISAAKAH